MPIGGHVTSFHTPGPVPKRKPIRTIKTKPKPAPVPKKSKEKKKKHNGFEYPSIFTPMFSTNKPEIVLSGGRGSGKSYAAALFAVREMMQRKMKVLVCRDIERALDDSSKELMEAMIDKLKWNQWFDISRDDIRCNRTGARAIFRGLKNAHALRSMESVELLIVEEAQYVSRVSLDSLLPTIRHKNARFLFCLNPRYPDDPVFHDFLDYDKETGEVRPADPKNTLHIHANLDDNGKAEDTLYRHRERDRRRMDPGEYEHKWYGTIKRLRSDLVIPRGIWRIHKRSEPRPRKGPVFFGMDLGVANHWTVLLAVRKTGPKQYFVEKEISMRGSPHGAQIPEFLKQIGAKAGDTVWSDWQQLENDIDGIKIRRVQKSQKIFDLSLQLVKDSDFLISEDCPILLDNLEKYKYKRDLRTDEITETIEKRNDDGVSALRYGMWGGLRQQKRSSAEDGDDGFGLV